MDELIAIIWDNGINDNEQTYENVKRLCNIVLDEYTIDSNCKTQELRLPPNCLPYGIKEVLCKADFTPNNKILRLIIRNTAGHYLHITVEKLDDVPYQIASKDMDYIQYTMRANCYAATKSNNLEIMQWIDTKDSGANNTTWRLAGKQYVWRDNKGKLTCTHMPATGFYFGNYYAGWTAVTGAYRVNDKLQRRDEFLEISALLPLLLTKAELNS